MSLLANNRVPTYFFSKILSSLVGIILVFFNIVSCVNQNELGNQSNSIQQLLSEFDNNRLKWENVGAKDYSFAIHKQCDCATETITPIEVDVINDDDELLIDATTTVKPITKPRKRKADQFIASRLNTTPRVENMQQYFSDLRQAITNGRVNSVSYDPTYGYPTTVQVKQANNGSVTSASFHTRDFQLESKRCNNRDEYLQRITYRRYRE